MVVGMNGERSIGSVYIWGRRRRHLNTSILKKFYIQEGWSIRAIAQAWGVSSSHVWRELRRAGIPTRDPGRRKNGKIEHVSEVGTLGQVPDSKGTSWGKL